MEKEKTVVELGDKVYVLSHTPFDPDIDMDDLTFIHYDNLIGEIITIPTLMNRVGILKAHADNAVSETKLAQKILEAEKGEHYRKSLITSDGKKTKYPTVAAVEDAVTMDEEVSTGKMMLYSVEKQAAVIDSLYWAIQSKQKKIEHISKGITPEDFENDILEGSINGILIKKNKKVI